MVIEKNAFLVIVFDFCYQNSVLKSHLQDQNMLRVLVHFFPDAKKYPKSVVSGWIQISDSFSAEKIHPISRPRILYCNNLAGSKACILFLARVHQKLDQDLRGFQKIGEKSGWIFRWLQKVLHFFHEKEEASLILVNLSFASKLLYVLILSRVFLVLI